jgi:hypothetical protein
MDYAHTPGLLIVGEDGDARAAAERAGARVLASLSIEAAAADIADRPFDALLIAADEESPALARLLAQVGGEGDKVILSLAPSLLDLAWSLVPDACLLSGPSADERAAAIRAALAPVDALVAESRDHPGELLRLSAEAGRIAQALAELSIDRGADEAAPDAARIRALIRARRLRDRFFDGALFADPAWDMMLDLFAARLEARQVAVSSLCIAAAVPTTTALRWIRGLTDAGLLVRVADPSDGRRFFVALADPVADALSGYFAELRRLGLPDLS